MRFRLILMLLFIVPNINAQNLIPNANFEAYLDCPEVYGDFNAENWDSYWTADYFNACDDGDFMDVPDNDKGYQESMTGSGYCGVIVYHPGYREYIQAELISETIENACYELLIIYSQAERAGSSNGLGMYLSNGKPLTSDGYIEEEAQLEKEIVQEDKTEWHSLKTEYVSIGNETHVTIGNFNSDENTTHIGAGVLSFQSYFYIDSVAVNRIGEYSVDIEVNLGEDLDICESDFPVTIFSNLPEAENFWSTGEIGDSIVVNQTGTYYVKTFQGCEFGVDTINIGLIESSNLSDLELPEVYQLCEGDTLEIHVPLNEVTIEWSFGSSDSSILITEAGDYWLALSNNCNMRLDSFQVVVTSEIPEASLGEDVTVCAGELLEFDLELDEGISILWSNGGDETQNQFSETTTIWLELTNSCGTDSDTLELVVTPDIETFELPADITICDDGNYEIESGITQSDVSILWNNQSTESSIIVYDSRWYWLEVSNDCFVSTDSIRVDFHETAQAFDLGMDDTICSGESIQLEAFQGDDYTYNWQDNSNTSDYTITESGTYSLEISNACGTAWDEITIQVLEVEEIDVPLQESYVLCNDIPLRVDLTTAIVNSVIWNDGSTDLERIFTEPGAYFVQFINSCSDTLFNFVFEQENCLNEHVYIPNSFSPNNDGMNDYFSIWFSENWLSPKIKAEMYNRWGEQIFYSEDPAFQWDGQFKGKAVNPGVYVFYFEIEVEIDGETKRFRETGDITVIK